MALPPPERYDRRRHALGRLSCPIAYYFLGAAYNNLNQNEEAIGAFQQAVRLKPKWDLAYSGLGVAYNCAGRFEASLAALREAIRLKPDRAQAYVNLSATYANLRRFGEAAEASRQPSGSTRNWLKPITG